MAAATDRVVVVDAPPRAAVITTEGEAVEPACAVNEPVFADAATVIAAGTAIAEELLLES